ncbi:GNAT family N-acetyltransferase [Actinokineospora sp. 24-640]
MDSAAGVAILREYLADVIGSYYGRPATAAEIALEHGDGDPTLAPPGGIFLVGDLAGVDSGCVGVRLMNADTAELKRLYVRAPARGTGGGAALAAAAEAAARGLGARALRLDTRSDLVAARALYARRGYREIPAYNREPYAQHWFEKTLE